MRTSFPLAALCLLAACQEPFGADRHDLIGFRVASVRAAPAGDQVQLGLAAVVEGHPWADRAPTFAWLPTDDDSTAAAALLDPQDAVATGPAPLLDRPDTAFIVLIATYGDQTYRAIVPVPPMDAAAPDLTGLDVLTSTLDLATLQVADVTLDARRALADGDHTDTVAPGGALRLRARVSGDPLVRFMSTAPGGTFLELDRQTTDWLAGHLVVDDDEIDEATPDDEGPRTVLALALADGGTGNNRFVARDLYVGPVPTGLYTSSGRFLPADATPPGPYVQGTLVADDAAPSGLALTGATPVTEPGDFGTAALPCAAPVSGAFDPTWLLEHRCTRQDVLGATVVVEVR